MNPNLTGFKNLSDLNENTENPEGLFIEKR